MSIASEISRLQTAKADLKTSIEGKGVTVPSSTTIDGYPALVDSIASGGNSLINKVARVGNLFGSRSNLPETIEISFEKLDSGNINGNFLYRSYETGKNTPTIIVKLDFPQTTNFSLREMFWQAYGVKEITITGNLNKCTSYAYAFDYIPGVRKITAMIDFTSCASDTDCIIGNSGTDNTYLTDLTFVQNTASYTVTISKYSALNDASIISAANCLIAGVSGKSLKLHATPKARCNTLMGTNDNGTFVADENGTLSLADFITTVKGWTLA